MPVAHALLVTSAPGPELDIPARQRLSAYGGLELISAGIPSDHVYETGTATLKSTALQRGANSSRRRMQRAGRAECRVTSPATNFAVDQQRGILRQAEFPDRAAPPRNSGSSVRPRTVTAERRFEVVNHVFLIRHRAPLVAAMFRSCPGVVIPTAPDTLRITLSAVASASTDRRA